jgi:hypothetical protein
MTLMILDGVGMEMRGKRSPKLDQQDHKVIREFKVP